MTDKFQMLAKTFKGLEPVLADELIRLGFDAQLDETTVFDSPPVTTNDVITDSRRRHS